MELVKETIENTAGIYILSKTPINNYVNKDDNILSRNLKRGFIYYLLNETIEQINTSNSNFKTMDPWALIDDTAYLGIVSTLTETTNLPSIIDNVIPNGYVSNDIKQAVVSGAILTGFNYIGDNIHEENFSMLRHLGSKIKSIVSF